MCGIVSIILKDTTKAFGKESLDIFKQMLYADALRGWDSTGIACIKHNKDVQVIKDNKSSGPFLASHNDNKWGFQNRAIIGHNRWATRGKTTPENAHPFQEGDITLVHNGTLRFHYMLKDVEVDSHAITHAIAEKGAIETLEVLDGAYALCWHDKATNNIYATRNLERPLFLVETQDLFILSSEKKLPEWICDRNNVKIRKIFSLTPGVLYTFKINKQNHTIIEQKKYEMLAPKVYVSPAKEYLPSPNNVTQIKPYNKTQNDSNLLEGIEKGDKIEVLPFKKTVETYRAYGLGKVKWVGEYLGDHRNLIVEFYTDDETADYTERVVEVTVHGKYMSAAFNTAFIICKDPQPIQKKIVADAQGPIASSNGIRLTDQVIEKAKDCLCSFCSEPFKPSADIVLIPEMRNGHLYKYTYYCPDCTEWYYAKLGRQLK